MANKRTPMPKKKKAPRKKVTTVRGAARALRNTRARQMKELGL